MHRDRLIPDYQWPEMWARQRTLFDNTRCEIRAKFSRKEQSGKKVNPVLQAGVDGGRDKTRRVVDDCLLKPIIACMCKLDVYIVYMN